MTPEPVENNSADEIPRPEVDKTIFHFVFSLYTISILSGAFGIAFERFCIFLILLISSFSITKYIARKKTGVEILFYLFLASIFLIEALARLNLTNYFILLEEYYHLIFAPIIAFSAARFLNIEQIVLPVFFALVTNALGNFVIILDLYYHSLLGDILNAFLGIIHADGNRWTFSSERHQAILAVFAFALFLFVIEQQRIWVGIFSFAIIFLTTLFLMFHAIKFMESRTLLIMLTVFVLLCVMKETGNASKVYFGFLFCLVIFVVWYSVSTIGHKLNVIDFLNWQILDPSIADRWTSWRALKELEINQFFFGVGMINVDDLFDFLYKKNMIRVHHWQWRDFHSEYITIIVIHGFFCFTVFLCFIWSFLKTIMSMRCEGLAKFFGLASFVSFAIFGLFNSVSTSSNERDLVLVVFVVWLSILMRQSKEKFPDEGA